MTKTLKDLEIENGFDSLKQISKEYPEFSQYHKVVRGYNGKAIFIKDLRKEAKKQIDKWCEELKDSLNSKTTEEERKKRSILHGKITGLIEFSGIEY